MESPEGREKEIAGSISRKNGKKREKTGMKSIRTMLLMIGMIATLLAGCAGADKTPPENLAGDQTHQESLAEEQVRPEAMPEVPTIPESAAENSLPEIPLAENQYLILVRDAGDGTPVAGVMVQFCSDTMCMVGLADENGYAFFEADPGNYTAHVLKAPEDYEATGKEIALTAENRMVVLPIPKAGEALPGNE